MVVGCVESDQTTAARSHCGLFRQAQDVKSIEALVFAETHLNFEGAVSEEEISSKKVVVEVQQRTENSRHMKISRTRITVEVILEVQGRYLFSTCSRVECTRVVHEHNLRLT